MAQDADGYDWTKGEQDDPSARYDNIQTGGGYSDGKTLDKIDEEAVMSVPVGTHTFLVKAIKVKSADKESNEPVERPHEVYVNGSKKTYFAYDLAVTLCMKDDPDKTMTDFFTLPPSKPEDMQFYMTGTRENVQATKNNVGFHWRKWKHFLGHLGIPVLEDGRVQNVSLKEVRFYPGGVPREIVATIVPPRANDKGTDGTARKFNQIELFSYKTAETTLLFQANAGSGNAPFTPNGTGTPSGQSVQEALEEVEI